jgi:multidrug/hemolysin transport system permease protein
MNIILALVNRNLKVYLRNKAAVFFSFLAVIIIIGLYALFLGEVQISSIESQLGYKVEGMGWLVNSWILAGLLSVNTVTVTLGTFGTIVDDFESKASRDFLSAPIGRTHIVLGYLISSWIISFLLTFISFIIVEVYIVIQGGELLSFKAIIFTILILILSIISFSSFLFYIVSFVKSSNAFGALSSILGTLIGFIAGIYIPIGVLPKTIQSIVSLIPVSYSASMLRQIHMKQPTELVFNNASSEIVDNYYKFNGVKLYIGDYELTWVFMILGLIVFALIFYTLAVIRVLKSKF